MKKKIVWTAWAAAALLAVVAAGLLLQKPLRYRHAELLYAGGDYLQAETIYAGLMYRDSQEKATECEYLLADQMFASGGYAEAKMAYDRLGSYKKAEIKSSVCEYLILSGDEKALMKEIFSSLDDEQDNQKLLTESKYILASIELARGHTLEAIEQFALLDGFADSAEIAEGCRKSFYDAGVEEMLRRNYGPALENFERAGEYEQSRLYGDYCRHRMESSDVYAPEGITKADNLIKTFEGGNLYYYSPLYVYLPNQIDSDTGFLVYFSGGDGEYYIKLYDLFSYLEDYSPQSICIFYQNSGFPHMGATSRTVVAIADQLAAENGISIHNLGVVGSSNGAYTAMQTMTAFYQLDYVRADKMVTLDTGMDWGERDRLLSREDQILIAQAGIPFYLFEQDKTGTKEKPIGPITDLARNGNKVTLVYCVTDDHENITRNAFLKGVLSWATGEIELDKEEYTLSPFILS